ncbi:MAG: 2-hydroxyacid dehydrogenase [Gammaproteobacteria bacterium]|nr:2-hydroxyacid dehydrogenase [Gammaproteobacteria bacterium]
MRLLLKGWYPMPALEFIRSRLDPEWEIRLCDREQVPASLEESEVFARELGEAHSFVSMSWSAAMPGAPELLLLQLPGAGVNQIDFDAVPPQCSVCNVFEHEIGIAEYLVLAILEWEIGLRHMDASLREGVWSDGFALGRPLHGELHGKSVGFIGYGRISRETARRLRPFGVRLRACTRSPEKGDEFVDVIADMDGLDAMLADCDYVVVACPLTDETRGLVDADALARLQPSAVIVNVARGEIIDEQALYEACHRRQIGGAVIDTWYRYPTAGDPDTERCLPSRYPFQSLDNVIMTPHASGWSGGLLERRWRVMIDNFNRLSRGEPLLNVVHAPG